MKIKSVFAIFLLLVGVSALVGFVQGDSKLDAKQLRDMLVQLGYEVKDINTEPGKEKYSVVFNKGGLDIPVGYEVSPSKNYIWLTVNLGAEPAESSAKCYALLKQNGKIQPCQFYLTESSKLMMMAYPVENSGLTNALLRSKSETITNNVANSKDIWQKQ